MHSIPSNYREAARRHLRDANHLWESQDAARKANASQLFGVCGECALKAILIGLGLPTWPDGGVKNPKKYGHFPDLWNEFTAFASGPAGGKYLAMLQGATVGTKPFDTWAVHDRYAPDNWLAVRHSHFADHRITAQDCLKALEAAEQDGIVK